MAGESNLDEIAAKELLSEAKRGAARASVYGALGWQKCPLKPTNKIFLQNMLLSAISSNRQKVTAHSTEKLGVKRKEDSNSGDCVTNKPKSSEMSDPHKKEISPDIYSNKTASVSDVKSNIKASSRKKKDPIHYSKRVTVTKHCLIRIKSESLKSVKDSNLNKKL